MLSCLTQAVDSEDEEDEMLAGASFTRESADSVPGGLTFEGDPDKTETRDAAWAAAGAAAAARAEADDETPDEGRGTEALPLRIGATRAGAATAVRRRGAAKVLPSKGAAGSLAASSSAADAVTAGGCGRPPVPGCSIVSLQQINELCPSVCSVVFV